VCERERERERERGERITEKINQIMDKSGPASMEREANSKRRYLKPDYVNI
jgi:hypothetical protein